ncbi:hypothetical protein QUF61_15320 [Candidatus Venteria ishoeyi]|uniref:hypothetical protein n=1 Tax=Candidatus Venteria ishoeyi TaxID=1899563 RepID=UPI0025A588DD|nr:hypothetical protein [Candidatus Venteria ishoeyi]MDM8547860.1 hypothetical protein [Candidatus Venteria ishoeyi]
MARTTSSKTTRKKRNPKKQPIATYLMLSVLAIIVAAVAYKQIVLAGMISSNLPETKLNHSLEVCFQKNLTPDQIKHEVSQFTTQQSQSSSMTSFGGLDLSGMLGTVLDQVTGSVVETQILENHITESKVMNIQDFMGKQAEIRVQGRVEIAYQLPVVGEIRNRKDYQTVLFKRDQSYYFESVSVKKPESNQWDEWPCSQNL